jgi:serine/threonine protein kinase
MHPASLPPGAIVGSWRLLSLASQGSYGVVFRAESISIPDPQPVALKFALQPGDPRFPQEVKLLSLMQHPNVPRLHDSGEWTSPGGTTYSFLVMDWVDGLPLYSWARIQPRSSREVLRVLAQGASALQAVHAADGLHRDFKGDNFLVRPEDGHAVLVDFGSCTFPGAPAITRSPVPPGTPQYQSPQAQSHQWRFRRHGAARYVASAADDVYALGVTAYRLVTGSYPLFAEDIGDPEELDVFFRFPGLVPADTLAQFSPELARWIRQMLSVQPAARGTPAELAVGLTLSANTEGPAADLPIGPLKDPENEASITLPRSQRFAFPWHVWFSAAAFTLMLMAGGGLIQELLLPPSHAAALSIPQASQLPSAEGQTSGLGELALPEPLSTSEPVPTHRGINAPVPAVPLPGQRTAPCQKPLVEINGSCWFLIGNETPPCSNVTFEWRKQCYLPFMGTSRPLNTREN